MADYELDTLDIGDITKEAERLNKEQNSGGMNDNYVRMPEKDGFEASADILKIQDD